MIIYDLWVIPGWVYTSPGWHLGLQGDPLRLQDDHLRPLGDPRVSLCVSRGTSRSPRWSSTASMTPGFLYDPRPIFYNPRLIFNNPRLIFYNPRMILCDFRIFIHNARLSKVLKASTTRKYWKHLWLEDKPLWLYDFKLTLYEPWAIPYYAGVILFDSRIILYNSRMILYFSMVTINGSKVKSRTKGEPCQPKYSRVILYDSGWAYATPVWDCTIVNYPIIGLWTIGSKYLWTRTIGISIIGPAD
jgi:hypothetical protein